MKRRTFIQKSSMTAMSISAFGTIHWNGKIFTGDGPTTTDILGPFYRPGAPIRSNIVPENSKGKPLTLKGTLYKNDNKTPLKNALVEIWQCDENEQYDNISDSYLFRGALESGRNGTYEFETIIPVPYKANPENEASWRPAHIHMRVSVADQQDLITQLYFKNDKYIDKDRCASSPQAINRILNIQNNGKGGHEVVFDVLMRKEFSLEPEVYNRIAGLYKFEDSLIEFEKKGDLLFTKMNGQYVASLKYIGKNTFEEKIENLKVTFELVANGGTIANINYYGQKITAQKFLKYNDR